MSAKPSSAGTNPAQEPGSEQLIPCHCIIGHPDKPKFLVIRHGEGWAPPVLQVPANGSLMYKPSQINHGMMRKYGLRTTVLRQLVSTDSYSCVELELHASAQSELQAIWMDLEAYRKHRRGGSGRADPFESWLREKQKGSVPGLRSPWEVAGWYAQASHWIQDRLVALGIQATGSIQQFKAGWPGACLLRVATSHGQVYFKAAYAKPPGEAALAGALAAKWPEIVPQPLAAEPRRNWLLMRDFGMKKDNRPRAPDYPAFARALGRLQVEAALCMSEWREMSVPEMGLEYLSETKGRAGRLLEAIRPSLTGGRNALGDDELRRLQASIEGLRGRCAELAEFGIPETLTHLDFRPDNFFVDVGCHRIMDWTDVALTHPFFGLAFMFDFFDKHGSGQPGFANPEPIGAKLREEIKAEYLSAFGDRLSPDRLAAAFALAEEIHPFFALLNAAVEMSYIEPGSLQAAVLRKLLRNRARVMLAGRAA